ncbi:MAG: diacylglycerol kinase family protein [Planctomycetota bacterium]
MRAFIASFGYAFAGIGHAFKTQRNLRVHAGALVLVLALGFWLRVSLWEWALLVITIALVVALELVNSALEAMLDLLHPQHDSRVKAAKDTMAGAVLVAALGSVAVGVLVFGPKLASVFLRG